ncbi:NepR family anti-sigma factor [Methylobacterium sp. E-005]|uniref:NepR family anti-sigma factor n=1 Tax=Methylobacterium sp. E-005 TaxID=2836549 RepID=UPI00391C16BF
MSGSKNERAVSTAPRADAADTVVAFPSARRPPAPQRAIDAAVQERIGRGLRLHYADVLALPVPDRLLTLLDALADTEAQP